MTTRISAYPVSAPAGFGKTTLLVEWVAQADRPVAWLALDAGDNDPNRFLWYIIAGLYLDRPWRHGQPVDWLLDL